MLLYNDLSVVPKIKKQFDKVLTYLSVGDFKSADVKKMVSSGYYRAKLDDTNRLLFQIGEWGEKKYIMVLEVILNHEYEKSRFLRGYGTINESDFVPLSVEQAHQKEDSTPLSYVNEKTKQFNILDKIISFDQLQCNIEKYPMPVIIIGSAGSGKTALTLEKMKTLKGKILYVSLSSFLVENAKKIYYSNNYENEKQDIDFLSFTDLLNSIEVVEGKEIDFKTFDQWIWRYKEGYKIKDTYKLFEEFKGVITGTVSEQSFLSEESYLKLGIKQSIFPEAERKHIYELFRKYIQFLNENKYYDANIIAYQHTHKASPNYDYVIVDEVQDITSVQLKLIMACIHNKTHFMLCGDSNQIVHPNFFSWAKVKTLFFNEDIKGEIIQILATNYRNTPEVTQIANKLLLVKNARFGSIDKESTYLVQPNTKNQGEVVFYENNQKIKSELNTKTSQSAKFAVIVLRNEDKSKARQFFNTPLLFSVQEAKGLEYENVILFDIISGSDKEFREIAEGVSLEDIASEEIIFARSKDKSDKSLDEYKFYINALYVAITRAIKNLYVVESLKKHELLKLLDLVNFQQKVEIQSQNSSAEEWLLEAKKLDLQGKKEQADAIRNDILKVKKTPWEVVKRKDLDKLYEEALNPNFFNKKAKDKLFLHALIYSENHHFVSLSNLKYKPADEWETKGVSLMKRTVNEYIHDNVKMLQNKIHNYGLDYCYEFNMTPLHVAGVFGSMKIIDYLMDKGVDTTKQDNYGRNFFNILLYKSYTESEYGGMMLNKYYSKIKNQSLKIKIDNKVHKIEHYQGEYLILSYMLTNFREKFISNLGSQRFIGTEYLSFQTSDFIEFYNNLSYEVLPDYRKNRAYISSILSKNEVSKDDKYNKKLFVRLSHGSYVPNPTISIQIEDDWVNILDLLDINRIREIIGKSQIDFIFFILGKTKELLEDGVWQGIDFYDFREMYLDYLKPTKEEF